MGMINSFGIKFSREENQCKMTESCIYFPTIFQGNEIISATDQSVHAQYS